MTDKAKRQMRLGHDRARREQLRRWPIRFEVLAVYNAEQARGIMHTPEWVAEMAELQAETDAWLESIQ